MRRAAKSTLLAALAVLTLWGQAVAHEVRPAIGDVTIEGDSLRLELQLTLEALVSGIDLAGIADTNESPLSGFYDQMRSYPPEQLEAAFRADWPRIRQGVRIEVAGARVTPEIADLRIPPVGDTDLPRDSVLVLEAALPPGDDPVIAGWDAAFGPLVLRQQGEGDELYTGYLTNGQMSEPMPRQGVATLGAWKDFGRYIVIGFEHILPKGTDHILFVLGLFFFSLHIGPLLWQVTSFTLAHTVTLALATLGIVSVSPAIVEPLIAASIVFVAAENLMETKMSWRRIAVVFVFGLLHGLGFASVLGEIGLNPARLVAGLIGFNIGVELGQLAVISLAFLAVGLWFGRKPWYRARIAVPASVVIGAVGAWWFVERTLL